MTEPTTAVDTPRWRRKFSLVRPDLLRYIRLLFQQRSAERDDEYVALHAAIASLSPTSCSWMSPPPSADGVGWTRLCIDFSQ